MPAQKLSHAQARALSALEKAATKNLPWRDAFSIGESITTMGALEKREYVDTSVCRGDFGWYTRYYRITIKGVVARAEWRG